MKVSLTLPPPAPQSPHAQFLLARGFVVRALCVVGLCASTLGGCRNWCHSPSGLQTKSQSNGTCTTPGDKANAAQGS